jgi:metal-responsive CopG/Arc/MetJ family transcriptional regulator
MYRDTMRRTQVYLGAEDLELLDREAARTGASRSELIRRAIRVEARRGDLTERLKRVGLA